MKLGNLIAPSEKRCISAYGLFAFFLLLPFEYPLATFGIGSVLRYVGIVVIVLAVWDIFRLGGKIQLDYRIALLLLWMLYATISGLWSVDKNRYSYYISMYINNALMFLMISAVRYTEKDMQLINKGYIGSIVLLLLYMTFVPGAVVSSSWQSRLTLAYQGKELLDQNYLAALMLMQFGIVLYDLMNTQRKRFTQILMSVFVITILYYIVRTGSRGGLLAAGVIAFLCICVGLKKRRTATWVFMGIVLVLVPMVLNVLPDDLLERFSLKAMTGNTSESGGRLQIWKVAWEAIKTGNVILGYGAGSSEYVIGLNYQYDAAVHNAFIAQVLELGIVGLTLFISLIVNMLRELGQQKHKNLLFAFCGILIASMFLDVLTTKFFWGAMMLLSVQISTSRHTPVFSEEGLQTAQEDEISN